MSDADLTQLVGQWLQYAPKPPPQGENVYDAFISYRSADRAWAMALYDVLKLAGWQAFLDQYDLVPGTNLETSLTEALEASSAGVILWSSRTKDSKWCERERNAMRALKERRNSTFWDCSAGCCGWRAGFATSRRRTRRQRCRWGLRSAMRWGRERRW